MKICQATKKDLPFVRNIALSLVVPGNSKVDTGFFDYDVPSLVEYEGMLNNKYFYVAWGNDRIIGFFITFTDSHFSSLNVDEGDLREYLLKLPKPFIYAYTLGISPEFQSKGVAKRLYLKFFEDIAANNYKVVYGVIVHLPNPNKKSINLHLKLGFKLIHKLEIEGLTFGIYKKELP